MDEGTPDELASSGEALGGQPEADHVGSRGEQTVIPMDSRTPYSDA